MPIGNYRSDKYLEAQGYIDAVREVKLTRADYNTTYTATEETCKLPNIAVRLEGDRHSVSEIGSLSVEFITTDKFKIFLEGLTNPDDLTIEVLTYQLFNEAEKYSLWKGVLDKLPDGGVTYISETIVMHFVTPAGKWLDAGDVKNPATGEWWVDSHITDDILPALLDSAKDDSGFIYSIETPLVRSDNKFWSGITRPKKWLADKNRTYDNTCEVTGICYGNGLLYIGVHDARATIPYSYPWIISYNPNTREWRKVTRAVYKGAHSYLRNPIEWVFQHLEYDAGTIYFVCRTNHPNLLDRQAHYHCRGSFAAAAPPDEVDLLDANLFTLHDRGQVIKSRSVYLDNLDWDDYPPATAGVDYYGFMNTQMIGWATPRHDVKECSIFYPSPKRGVIMPPGLNFDYGRNYFFVYKTGAKRTEPKVGDYCIARENNNDYRQYMGRVLAVNTSGPDTNKINVEKSSEFCYTGAVDWEFYFIDDTYLPHDNIFVAEPQEVSVEYLFPDDIGSPDSEEIWVERRKSWEGFGDFHWPPTVTQITDSGKHYIDDVGYMSFSAIRDLGIIAETGTYKKYMAGESAPFKIQLQGYNPAFLLSQGFWVASALQGGEHRQPGKCRLIHNGATVKLTSGEELKTYGNIYLYYDGSRVWVAWNDHGQDVTGAWFSQCKVGYWDGTNVKLTWKDRGTNNWGQYPEAYITSLIRFNSTNYMGRIYNERDWIDTKLRIFWAKSPEPTISPAYYDNRLVATCAVKGDKTEILQEGSLIRLRDITATPYNKTYRVSSVQKATREFGAGGYAVPSEVPYSGDITYFTLIGLDPPSPGRTHIQVITQEALGKYITIDVGRDRRAEIARIVGGVWNEVYIAQADISEVPEGQEVARDERRWDGELLTITVDEDYLRFPRMPLSNRNVVLGSVSVTLTASGEELTVEDLTSDIAAHWYPSWPEPPANTCYIHRKSGGDKNETYLYFNNDLIGQEVNVDYQYCINTARMESPFIFDSKLCFIESGPRYKFKYTTAGGMGTWYDDYSPRLGDNRLEALVSTGTELYGVSSPSWLLVHYGTDWTGFITFPVNGENKTIWSIVGSLARAANCYCWESNGTVYLRRRDSYSDVTAFKNIMDINEVSPIKYKRVILGYANGQVDAGDGNPELSLSVDYVYDKGHADAICNKISNYYVAGRREFIVTCNGILDNEELLTAKIFDYQGNNVVGIIVGIEFTGQNTTVFYVAETEGKSVSGVI